MRGACIFFAVLCLSTGLGVPAFSLEKKSSISPEMRWVVIYQNEPELASLASFDVVVLDAETKLSPFALRERKKRVFGYVSLGEVENHRAHYSKALEAQLTLKENKSWPGSYYVDVRNPEWARLLIEEVIPPMVRKGFNGLFLDTLDNVEDLENENPKTYLGMKDAAIELVRLIHAHYPTLSLIQNRGYQLLPHTAASIEYVLAECVHSCWNETQKKYVRVEEEGRAWQKSWLLKAKAVSPSLSILSLDYWDPADVLEVSTLYREAREQGFVPYVSVRALDRVVEEPQP